MPDQTPEYRYLRTEITTPAGTASSSPLKTTVDLGVVRIVEAQIVIPDGHAGQTGIGVVYDSFGIVPWNAVPQFIRGNAEDPVFSVDFTVGHALSVWTYNGGAFDHLHLIRWKVRDPSLDQPGQLPQLAVIRQIPDATTTSTDETVASGGGAVVGV